MADEVVTGPEVRRKAAEARAAMAEGMRRRRPSPSLVHPDPAPALVEDEPTDRAVDPLVARLTEENLELRAQCDAYRADLERVVRIAGRALDA